MSGNTTNITGELPKCYGYFPFRIVVSEDESKNTILPEIDEKIISFLDLNSKIFASGLNTITQKLLPNIYFFEVLNSRFPVIPTIQSIPKFFPKFVEAHPVSYVKGICKMMCDEKYLRAFPDTVIDEALAYIFPIWHKECKTSVVPDRHFTYIQVKNASEFINLTTQIAGALSTIAFFQQLQNTFPNPSRIESLEKNCQAMKLALVNSQFHSRFLKTIKKLSEIDLDTFKQLIQTAKNYNIPITDWSESVYKNDLLNELSFIEDIQDMFDRGNITNILKELINCLDSILTDNTNLGFKDSDKLTPEDLVKIDTLLTDCYKQLESCSSSYYVAHTTIEKCKNFQDKTNGTLKLLIQYLNTCVTDLDAFLNSDSSNQNMLKYVEMASKSIILNNEITL